MKRSLALLPLIVLLLLYGCGGTAAPTNTPVPVPTATTAPPAATTAPAATVPPTATTQAVGGITTEPTAAAATPAPAATGTTGPAVTPTVLEIPAAAPPAAATLTVTPPALPAPTTFTGTPGTSIDTATAVDVPVTITAVLADSSVQHFYKLDLSKFKGGLLVTQATVPKTASDSLDIRLYDESGNNEMAGYTVDAAKSGGHQDTLDPGVYILRVANGASSDPYTLAVMFYPNNANSDQASAIAVPLAGTTQGYVSSEKDALWFKVDTSAFAQGGMFSASLQTPAQAQGTYLIKLMDATGTNEVAAQSVDSGKTGTVADDPAQPASYLLLVQSISGSYDFSDPFILTTSFAPHSAYFTPAKALAVTPPVLFRITVGSNNDQAFFSFKANAGDQATLKTTTAADGSGNVVAIYESSGQNRYNSQQVDPGQENTLAYTFDNNGTYLISIGGVSGSDKVSKSPVEVLFTLGPSQ